MVMWLLNIVNSEKYKREITEGLIRFSNTLQTYTKFIANAPGTQEIIISWNAFVGDFQVCMRRHYKELFPWIQDYRNSKAILEFEEVFVQEVRTRLEKWQFKEEGLLEKSSNGQFVFGIQSGSDTKSVFMFIKDERIIMSKYPKNYHQSQERSKVA